jgi:hypothetical protein
MTCSIVKLPGGGTAIVKHSPARFPRCKFCLNVGYGRQHAATLLCDFEIGKTLGGEPITCDEKICEKCARREGGKDFCPKHPK